MANTALALLWQCGPDVTKYSLRHMLVKVMPMAGSNSCGLGLEREKHEIQGAEVWGVGGVSLPTGRRVGTPSQENF